MTGVLRRYRLAVSPATSRQTPPPMAMMGSLRLHLTHEDLAASIIDVPKGELAMSSKVLL